MQSHTDKSQPNTSQLWLKQAWCEDGIHKLIPIAVVEYRILKAIGCFPRGWLNNMLDECKITDGYHAEAIHQNKI
jgi:hypothetical protein